MPMLTQCGLKLDTRLVLADTVTALTNQALNDLATAKADGDATRAYLDAVQAEFRRCLEQVA